MQNDAQRGGRMLFALSGFAALIPLITWRQAAGPALMVAGLTITILVGVIAVRAVKGRGMAGQNESLLSVFKPRVHSETQEESEPAPEQRIHPEVEQVAFLKNAVVGIIDDRQDIGRCVRALEDAGFAREDIHVIAGGTAGGIGAEQGWRDWPKHSLRVTSLVGDEGDVLDGYEEEWRAGHGMVAVHVRKARQAEWVADMLATHGAHQIKRFGQWSITDMPQGIEVVATRPAEERVSSR